MSKRKISNDAAKKLMTARKRTDPVELRQANREKASADELRTMLALAEGFAGKRQKLHAHQVHQYVLDRKCVGDSQAESKCFVQCARCCEENVPAENAERVEFFSGEWVCFECLDAMDASVANRNCAAPKDLH